MKRVNLDTETDVHRGKIMGEYTGRTPCEDDEGDEGESGGGGSTGQGMPTMASKP